MNLSKLTKANLITELEQRSLATNGLKDELIKRLKEAMDKESATEIDNQEENYDSEDDDDDNIDGTNDNKDNSVFIQESSDSYIAINETLNDDEIVKDRDSSTVLTVEDAINMKSTKEAEENCSMIVNIDDDDNAISISTKDETMDYEQSVGNRDTDNGDHEVIEISEEVVIDDEDNQENDNNFNEESFQTEQIQQDKDELENGESRDDESEEEEEKINLWVHNVAEDVKALELKDLFSKYGKVISAKVVMNNKNSTGNCFGCIQLCNNDDVENCIKNLDNTEFRGNTITVSKELSDLPPSKEKIQRQMSPISSSGSWGGGNKRSPSVKSISPLAGVESMNDAKKESSGDNKGDDERGQRSYRPPYRGGRGGGYRGNNNNSSGGGAGAGGNYGSRNYGQDSRGRDYDRPSTSDRRGGYSGSSRPDRDVGGYKGNNYDGRNERRDGYGQASMSSQHRDARPREEYGGGGGRYESRYQSGAGVSRDRHEFTERPSRGGRNYEEDSGRSGAKYDADYSDRRAYKPRPSSYQHQDQRAPRDSEYRRDEGGASYKRPRIDNGDDLGSGYQKRRREDYSPPRDRYRASPPPPKQRELHRPEYRERRDVYQSDRPSRDYSAAGNRPTSYGHGYSPDRRVPAVRPSTTQHGVAGYATKAYHHPASADFGGRSRNYEH